MTIASLIALAAVDSVNPSAIVITLYLLSRERAPVQVAVYLVAIFITYSAFGVTMMLGIDILLPSAGSIFRSRTGLIAQALVGIVLLVYSLRASTEVTSPRAPVAPSMGTLAALVTLGASVTVMELPTALPYFAAIALLTSEELRVQEWVPLLVMYNAIFVLPPLALLIGHLVAGERLAERYASLRRRLEREARKTLLWIAGLVGSWLLVTSAIELVARFA